MLEINREKSDLLLVSFGGLAHQVGFPIPEFKRILNPVKTNKAFFVDKNRCLPHAFGIECVVCEEMCPVSPKAIYFQEVSFMKADNKEIKIKQPVVIPDKCTGCAICENKCPVLDKPAIYVTSIGEDRLEKNQFLLDY